MQIIRIDYDNFFLWRSQIELLFNSSVKINFPGFSVDDHYGKIQCDEVEVYLGNGTAILFAAIEEEKLIGWIWCHQIQRLDRRRLHIAEIAVADECHRRGIGKKLLSEAEQYAVVNGYQEIDLLVTASNESAVKFYENACFEPERLLMKKNLKGKDACSRESRNA